MDHGDGSGGAPAGPPGTPEGAMIRLAYRMLVVAVSDPGRGPGAGVPGAQPGPGLERPVYQPVDPLTALPLPMAAPDTDALYYGDCLEWMERWDGECVDLILTWTRRSTRTPPTTCCIRRIGRKKFPGYPVRKFQPPARRPRASTSARVCPFFSIPRGVPGPNVRAYAHRVEAVADGTGFGADRHQNGRRTDRRRHLAGRPGRRGDPRRSAWTKPPARGRHRPSKRVKGSGVRGGADRR